ncbi:unnamed protein product [Cladocopium goreaui]|uniref:Protein kinase domain-containing protein n=1 Tax=Cladocopium goreaui TaxID=2562237 RepID=A0A9P1GHU5_9DINO|nr:unnamed protein product [Cladocopium goreaui]
MDALNSSEMLLESLQVHHDHVIVVTDRHALAAHEYWHRKTGSCWIDAVWISNQESYSCSGTLVALQRLEAPNQLPRSQLQINFAAADQVVKVEFMVSEVSHSEFEVQVLRERRHRRNFGDEVYLSNEEYSNLAVQLAGSRAAVGRVRTLDIVGGFWSAETRQCARHELSLQERQGKTLQLQRYLAAQEAKCPTPAAPGRVGCRN